MSAESGAGEAAFVHASPERWEAARLSHHRELLGDLSRSAAETVKRESGEWFPVPYVDERAAEELFRHKLLALLRGRGLSPHPVVLPTRSLGSPETSGGSLHGLSRGP